MRRLGLFMIPIVILWTWTYVHAQQSYTDAQLLEARAKAALSVCQIDGELIARENLRLKKELAEAKAAKPEVQR